MSLNIYFDKEKIPKNLRVISDVEKEFESTKLSDSEGVRILLKKIEKGTYCNAYSFIDRFGNKLLKSNISTGCKAAILVYQDNTIVVDLKECGYNAKSAIISYCKTGNILMPEFMGEFMFFDTEDIDVWIKEYNFKNLSELNQYLRYQFPGSVK